LFLLFSKYGIFLKKNIPFVKARVDAKLNEAIEDIQKSVLKDQEKSGLPSYLTLPEKGLERENILSELQKCREIGRFDFQLGKISGCVYNGNKELTILVSEAAKIFEWTNPLHADVFPGLRKIESEIVAMVVNMFNGTPLGACGTLTSGGTESILMAVRAHKEWAREEKGIKSPHIVMPITAHPAFDKAADYFGIRVTHVPVDPITGQVDLDQMRRSITSNTIMIVGSCPGFPWGIIDNIVELGKLAENYGVGLHVDCCLGSFLVAFMESAGFKPPLFDFRVRGVTSISCDTHKYGFAPKGSSVIMYRSQTLRRFQYFTQPNWPGGIYASPSIAGSRPGQVIAGCWATMMVEGKAGYISATHQIISNARKIRDEIKKYPELTVIGDPQVSVVAFKSDTIDVFRVSSILGELNWNLSLLQYPKAVHISCTFLTDADQFNQDLFEAMKKIRKTPSQENVGSSAFYGQSASVPDRSLVGRIAAAYCDALYIPVDSEVVK